MELDFVFNSSDHLRYENGVHVSGPHGGAGRAVKVEPNTVGEGYFVTIYNLDGIHPVWQNNIQMAPKQMKLVGESNNIIELRGFGFDENAILIGANKVDASYANYGILVLVENEKIERIQLNMYDRGVSIVYLK